MKLKTELPSLHPSSFRLHPSHARYPKRLTARLDAAQAARGQVLLFESEVCEVRQVAQNGLEPAAARERGAHARVCELRRVEGEHGEVLRRAGRGHGAQDALREVFAEEEAVVFEFEHRRDLLAQRERAHALRLLARESSARAPIFERGIEARAPEPQRVCEAST